MRVLRWGDCDGRSIDRVGIREAPAKCGIDNVDGAFAITVIASVPTAIKLREIARKVLIADMVERADDAALE